MGQAKNRGNQSQRIEQARTRETKQPALHPMDSLEDDTPVTVGMLRDSLDAAGQAVGFVLSGALLDAGLSGNKSLGIAQALHALTAQGSFPGPSGDVIAGIVYGINMHLLGTPNAVGQPFDPSDDGVR